MAESWVNSAERIGADLHLELSGPGGRRAALIRGAARGRTRTGGSPPGTRLPPYRSLAADLGVARNTVADAYAELVAEGWLDRPPGLGHPRRPARRAAAGRRARPHTAPARRAPPRARPAAGARRTPRRSRAPPGSPPPGARSHAAPNEAFGPGDPARPAWNCARPSPTYLARARGVRTEPGADRDLLGLRARPAAAFGGQVLRGPLAVESYGLDFHRGCWRRAGLGPCRCAGRGRRAHGGAGRAEGVRAVLLTPAHQFPTGGPLHPERRAAVVDWARARRRADPGGRLRRGVPLRPPAGRRRAGPGPRARRLHRLGQQEPVPGAAAGLDGAARPRSWTAVLAAKGEREAWASVLDQLTLADFIDSGAYDRHVRRMRQRYRPAGTGSSRRSPSGRRTSASPASRPGCTRCCGCRPAPSGRSSRRRPGRASRWTGSPASATRTPPCPPRRAGRRLRDTARPRLRRGAGRAVPCAAAGCRGQGRPGAIPPARRRRRSRERSGRRLPRTLSSGCGTRRG